MKAFSVQAYAAVESTEDSAALGVAIWSGLHKLNDTHRSLRARHMAAHASGDDTLTAGESSALIACRERRGERKASRGGE